MEEQDKRSESQKIRRLCGKQTGKNATEQKISETIEFLKTQKNWKRLSEPQLTIQLSIWRAEHRLSEYGEQALKRHIRKAKERLDKTPN